MVKRLMVMVFCIITAVVLCGVPQLSMAGSSSENEKKEEKKEKKQKQEKNKKKKKETESNDKAKNSNDPVGGVNKIYDGFKKGSGGVKDDADKSRKSINDSWQRSK